MQLKDEQKARIEIDRQLEAAGWVIQNKSEMNRHAAVGVAVREYQIGTGFADYLLFVDGKAAGVLEAKPAGTTLSGVAEQTYQYAAGYPENRPHYVIPLLFLYESTGVETYHQSLRDPEPRSRRLFSFHTPDTLRDIIKQREVLRMRLRNLPPLNKKDLRQCQIEAIEGLETSLRHAKPRALIQMATGSGKTYAAITAVYRLAKYAGAKRILFLVDRNTLGRQALTEFQIYRTPDDGRLFTELYNVQRLTSGTFDRHAKVCISTIQRVYSMLKGRELDEEIEEESSFESEVRDGPPVDVVYSPDIPIETFDFIIVDECHRSIYNRWRQVLEYFDAFIIGLTATPSKHTIGFFDKNLVTEYNHSRAVADGVNVGFDVYRIRTRITESGSKVEAGQYVFQRDRKTREQRYEQLDEELEYEASQLDRSVVTPDQIRTVIKTFRERLFTEIFPGRNEVPKTLVFAKDDNHAEEIVHIIRQEFGKGNDFCKKITYKVTGDDPETLIKQFRTQYNPRIAVSVDMIATGTDIRPLECLLFLRDVKSSIYFDQMKGRGTRVVSETELKSVTPDTSHKTHFVIVDAVGVTESDKTDPGPREYKKSVPLKRLMDDLALGVINEETISTLASRLARLDRQLTDEQKKRIEDVAGRSVKSIVNDLVESIDVDRQIETAKTKFATASPSSEQIKESAVVLMEQAGMPFNDPATRDVIEQIRRQNEITIDIVSLDEVIEAGGDEAASKRAREMVSSFKNYIAQHKDELSALQVFYSQPYGRRHLTLSQIKELAQSIAQPPLQLTPEQLWKAYAQLEKDKVKGVNEKRLLTDVISLVRHAMEEEDELVPFKDQVNERFFEWLAFQEREGRTFTPEQLEWLEMIKDHIAASLDIQMEDLQNAPFNARGGTYRATTVFGREQLAGVLSELSDALSS